MPPLLAPSSGSNANGAAGSATGPRKIQGSLSKTPGRRRRRQHNVVMCQALAGFLLMMVLCVGFFVVSGFLASIHGERASSSSSSSSPEKVTRPPPPPRLRTEQQANLAALSKLAIAAQQKKNAAAIPRKEEENEASVKVATETLVLGTTQGNIRLTLRPDWSVDSVDYIHRLVAQGCQRCKLYRAEEKGILQGIVAHPDVPIASQKGSCPVEFVQHAVHNDCPDWDKHCGCHGPLMTRGMVGWAAGATGPDFFIDNYRQPAKWWGTQHTVWATVADAASLQVIDAIFTLPTVQEELTFLKEHLHFTLTLESNTA